MLGLLSPFRYLAIRTIRTIARPTAASVGESYSKALSNAVSLKQVWNLISVHNKEMTETDVVETMKTLHTIIAPSRVGSIKPNASIDHLGTKHFQDLCHRAVDLMDKMSPSQLCQLLEFLQSFKVPISSKVFSQLLLTIDERLDEFNTYQITKMDMSLRYIFGENSSRNVLVEKIRRQLASHPEVKSTKADSSSENLYSLTRKFRTIADTEPNDPLVIDLFNEIYARREELNCLEAKNTLAGITKALFDLTAYDKEITIELTNECLEKVALSLNEVSEGEFCRIFTGIFYHKQFKYQDEWFNAAAEVYKKRFENASTTLMTAVLTVFAKHNHIDLDLLQLYYDRIVSTGESEKPNFGNVVAFFSSVAKFQPQNGWEPLVNLFSRYFESQEEVQSVSTPSLLRFATFFIYINKYPRVLDQVFNELSKRLGQDAPQLLTQLKLNHLYNLLQLNIALHERKVLSEDAAQLKGQIEPVIDQVIVSVESSFRTFTPAAFIRITDVLQKNLFPPGSFYPRVWTDQGLYIENLVQLGGEKRKPTNSVPVSRTSFSMPKFLETIERPPGSTLVCVMPLTRTEITKQGLIKSGCYFRMKAIQRHQIVIVPVQSSEFVAVSFHSRPNYLVSLIEKKLGREITDELRQTSLFY